MISKSFFKIKAQIKKPTQNQIELVRRRTLSKIKHGRGKDKLDAKSVEAVLRIVSGHYSNLLSALENENRTIDHTLDAKFAQGFKQAKSELIKIQQDVQLLEDMGYDKTASGIEYLEAVHRLRALAHRRDNKAVPQKAATTPASRPAPEAARAPKATVQPTDKRKTFATPRIHWVIVGVGMALSFIDMLLLSGALEKLLGTDQLNASVYAFCFAAVGTASAFLWGRHRALNKKARWWAIAEFWIWLFIGLIFLAIRAVVIFVEVRDFPEEAMAVVSSEVLMAAVLTILYAGTGLVVRGESKKIFDPELFKEWHNMQAAKKVQNTIANKYAEAERIIIELESFQKYYDSLSKQYVIHKNSLADAERTTLSSVVKQVLEDNPHLSPQVVNDILQSILVERKNRTLE